MVSRDDSKQVIWPGYFDASLPRDAGRKLSRKYACEKSPSLEDIAKAAKSLGLHPVIEKSVMHPSRTWKKEGRVVVEKKGPKGRLLIQIANRL